MPQSNGWRCLFPVTTEVALGLEVRLVPAADMSTQSSSFESSRLSNKSRYLNIKSMWDEGKKLLNYKEKRKTHSRRSQRFPKPHTDRSCVKNQKHHCQENVMEYLCSQLNSFAHTIHKYLWQQTAHELIVAGNISLLKRIMNWNNEEDVQKYFVIFEIDGNNKMPIILKMRLPLSQRLGDWKSFVLRPNSGPSSKRQSAVCGIKKSALSGNYL